MSLPTLLPASRKCPHTLACGPFLQPKVTQAELHMAPLTHRPTPFPLSRPADSVGPTWMTHDGLPVFPL